MVNKEVGHYVVTAHPPGGVLLTARCNFLSPFSLVSDKKLNACTPVDVTTCLASFVAFCDSSFSRTANPSILNNTGLCAIYIHAYIIFRMFWLPNRAAWKFVGCVLVPIATKTACLGPTLQQAMAAECLRHSLWCCKFPSMVV